MDASPRFDPVAILTLREIRAYIRNSSARGGVVFFALLYGLASAFSSGMILIASIPGGYTLTTFWSGPASTGFWNYPGVLLVAPWGVVDLPFFPTLAMVLVSIGVGYGMTVAFLLTLRLLKDRNKSGRGAGATGTVAGLTPAMITLVTLGACCSTTAAASAGVGLVAQASGTSITNLLVNNWFLGVFQIVVVWIALLAQELLLIVYAGIFGSPSESEAMPAAPTLDRRTVLSGAIRVVLLIGGVLWSLSMVAEWTVVAPGSASAGIWFQWLVQHQVVAGLAIAAALFPAGTSRVLLACRSGVRWVVPVMLAAAGATLLFAPPPLPAWGLDGLVNQMVFVARGPSAWGAIAPGGLGGAALALRWAGEYALLGGFAILAALWPDGIVRGLSAAPRRASVVEGAAQDQARAPLPGDAVQASPSQLVGP